MTVPVRRSIIVRTIALLLLAAAFVGCPWRETAVQRGDREQVLHRGIGPEPSTLDPHLVNSTGEIAVVAALFEGLVAEDPVDLTPVPGLAESWTISSDGLVYTFRLRPNLRWSDGTPLVAADFVASIRRALSPTLGSDYAKLLFPLENAEAYHRGIVTDPAQIGAVALDDSTVRLRLEHVTPHLLTTMTHPVWSPVPTAAIATYGPVEERSTPWARPGRLVGTGPFVLTAQRAGRTIVVERNPHYWDAATVRLRAIHFHPIDSVDAEERAFRAGQLHLTEALPVARIEAYRRQESPFLRIDPYLGTYFYRYNVTRPFLNEPKVRRALAKAVDREQIVERILRGGQLPAGGLVPPGMPGYEPPPGIRTDFEAARALLAEAGYPGGAGLPPFEILYNTSENHRLIAEAIQEMWRRELGVETRLVSQEFRVTLAARRTLDYQILRSSWIGDFLDASNFLEVFLGNGANNHTGWAHSGYDALVTEARRTPDPAARAALLRRAEEKLLAELPILPIYYYTHVFLIRPSVRNWHPTILDRHPYKYVYLQP